MYILQKLAGVIGLLLLALYNVSATAQETSEAVILESSPVVQELPQEPDWSKTWLDGKASLKGGEYTTSETQFMFAEYHNIPVVTAHNFNSLVQSGHLVRLEGPFIRLKLSKDGPSKVVPYVLPDTKDYILKLSIAFNNQGCGNIIITDALRIVGNKMPTGTSRFTVHTRGMAVDIRIAVLSLRCKQLLQKYSLSTEEAGDADTTEEFVKPHLHKVVVPSQLIRRSNLVANYGESTITGQSE